MLSSKRLKLLYITILFFFCSFIGGSCIKAQAPENVVPRISTEVDSLFKLSDTYLEKKEYILSLESMLQAYTLFKDDKETELMENPSFVKFSLSINRLVENAEIDSIPTIFNFFDKHFLSPDLLCTVGMATLWTDLDYAEKKLLKVLNEKYDNKKLLLHSETYRYLSRIYEAKGNYKKAKKMLTENIRILTNSSKENKLAIAYINLASLHLYDKMLDESRKCFKKAFPYVFKHKDDVLVKKKYFHMQKSLAEYIGDYNQAIVYNDSILQFGDSYAKSIVKWNRGLIYMKQGYYRQAIPLFEGGIELDKSINRYDYMGEAYYIIAECYHKLGVYDTAMHYNLEAIKYYRQLNQNYSLCSVYNAISLIQYDIGNENKAVKNVEKAVNCFRNNKKEGLVTYIKDLYISQYSFYEKTENYDSCFFYLNKYFKYITKNEMVYSFPEYYNWYGLLLLKEKKYEIAKVEFETGLNFANEIGIESEKCKGLLYLGQTEWHLKNYEEASKYIKRSRAIAEKIDYAEYLDDIYALNAEIELALGNYEEAYHSQVLSSNLRDSLFGFVQKDLVTKYETELGLNEVELEKNKLTKINNEQDLLLDKKNRYIYILFAILSFLAIISFTYNRISKRKLEKDLRKEIARDIHDDIGAILTRISRNTKLALEKEYENENIKENIQQTANLSKRALASFKSILWKTEVSAVSFKKFETIIKEHTKLNLGDTNLDINMEILGFDSERLVSNKITYHLFMIYKEAIHNIIKHTNTSKVNVCWKFEDKKILVKIENTYSVKHEKKFSTKRGLNSIRDRIKLLKGDVNILDSDKSFSIDLSVNV